MNYLIVVAHPDDEVLGAGATIKKLSDRGDTVDVCILCSGAEARKLHPGDAQLRQCLNDCVSLLGIHHVYTGDFPNIRMNTTAHLELVKFIEAAIRESEPDIVITHHAADVNNDHMHTSLACQAAARLFQRCPEVRPLRELWYMECLSSTEWSLNSSMSRFIPNTYIEAGKEGVAVKIKALQQYQNVMRPYPHPRSEEALTGLMAYRGAESGCNYAEAFECVFRRVADQ